MFQIKNNIHLHIKTKKLYLNGPDSYGDIFLMIRCGNKSAETAPNNIINEQQFTKILTDFLISESAINLNIKNVNNLKFDSVYAFNPLKENFISKKQYDATLQYYSQNPQLYKQIYEAALEQLSQLQTARKAKFVADSLQSIKLKETLLKISETIQSIARRK